MKRLIYQMWAKVLAMILCIAGAIGSFICAIGLILCQNIPSEKAILDTFYENITSNYSAMLLANMDEDDPEATLGGLKEITGMRYAIIRLGWEQDLSDAQENLKDPSIFVYGDPEIIDSYRYAFEGGFVGEHSSYNYDTVDFLQAIWNEGYYWGQESEAIYDVEVIQGFVFSPETGIFYTKTESGYYPINNIAIATSVYSDADSSQVTYFNDYYLTAFDSSGETEWHYQGDWGNLLNTEEYESWDSVSLGKYFDGLTILETDLPGADHIQLVSDASALSPVYEPKRGYFEDCYYHHENPKENPKRYWVLSYVDESSSADGFFSDARTLVEYITAFKKNGIGFEVGFLVLFVAGFAFLMAVAGHRKEDEKIRLRIWDRIPFGIYFVALCLIEIVGGFGIVMITELFRHYIAEMLLFLLVDLALMVFFALAFLMSIAVRIKAGCFWETTIFYRLFKRIRNRWRVFRQAVREHVSLFWKTVLCLLAVYLIELISLLFFGINLQEGGVLCWFVIFAAIRAGIILWAVLQMARIQKGSSRIAEGDLSTPIDTHEMFWEFKKHAENINKVGDGIAIAVEKQMKSERFRTELITNVSHDIKTPLTSIINYVDLIKKEEITDPKLVEYIDVLDRQSARLKKLIEDLMEASKASTGNLSVHLEKCDAGVFLGQAVGEFEERAAGNDLQLIVTTPQQPVQILADGRHLWRVFDNLLNNICKYAQPGTRVYISLEQRQMMAEIIFKNISKYPLNISADELMERFVRGDSSRNTEGSGLGLSIAQSLTNLMNGSMELEVDGDLFKVILHFPIV